MAGRWDAARQGGLVAALLILATLAAIVAAGSYL